MVNVRGVAMGWTGVDMSTPLLLEVTPEIDTNPTSFYRGWCRRGVGPLKVRTWLHSLLIHAGLHLGLTDISCSICTACFVVWRPRRAADLSTNRRQGFLCRRTASMEHAADTAEPAAVDHYFSSSTENTFSVPVCLRTPGRLLILLWYTLGLQ